ncbi:MAG: hypothetical protein VKO65_04595 [Cyanobacteriota bacterium]|nr:hypothetical protein [Cyanobacteriota bacterium]
MTFLAPAGDRRRLRPGLAPERYVLRLEEAGPFLGLDAADQCVHEVSDLGSAFQFHTHQRALLVARELRELVSRRISVIKIL